ncbi:protein DpdD [Aminobacter aminovorans]|uniref:Uncharacterized protein n=1 Tax=Aminobacter aminovorans TaxID=83263 RepID=A0AAC8YK55_AMIAI|nr:protein DpdD [Aminobacter aminovorans]AMS39349.1 hypothetical protein AA2016_0410 [Aminobacter aminovorans]MBB3707494.1 hypothetical protein [Aminobacter aminovorans]
MIGADIETARTMARDLSTFEFSALEPAAAELCTKLIETVIDPSFPGAIIPNVDATGDLRLILAAPTMTAWRRLSPVLRAFAGPTLTSFDGLLEPLSHGDPVVEIVMHSQPAATGVMRLPTKNRLSALRALLQARDMLGRAPNLQRAAPEPTSWLLARFQDYLNVGRRDAATDILARIKSELRLDSLNLKFLEVQLLATFSDWTGIVGLPGFANLCLARRSPAVTALLLEALYRVHLADPFDAGDASETRPLYEAAVRPFAQPMLSLPAPMTLKEGGWRIYGLESWIAPSRTDIALALVNRQDVLGWISHRLPAAVPAAGLAPEPTPLDSARSALVQVDAVESVDAVAAALAALAKLTSEELARLRGAEPFRSTLQVTDQLAEIDLPTSWTEWLAKTADPSFTTALDIARKGKDEWTIEAGAGDPVAVQALASALDHAQSNALATERTGQALPFLVAWLQRDPDFPRSAMTPIYASLLTLFALGPARGRGTYDSSQILVSALLTAGLDVKAYKALIADIEELAGDGFGVDMVYWVLEITEEFMRASAPDVDARESFLHGVLAHIAPIYARLTSLQRAAMGRLAQELGWTLQSLGISAGIGEPDDFSSRIQGLRIAIYSLTEAASRQAKAAIEEIAPTAIVDCNADHGGTARLRALAENADLFVMTWLSAKHAATDFIREHRANRPLLYAQGRGFSSILRAIEDHLS